MNLNNKVVTLNNKKQYIIIETVMFDNKLYGYLLNREEETDSIFREIITDDNFKLKKINKDIFEKNIFPLFIEKFKTYE